MRFLEPIIIIIIIIIIITSKESWLRITHQSKVSGYRSDKTKFWFLYRQCLLDAAWISQQLLASSCCWITLFQCWLLCKSSSFPKDSWRTYLDPGINVILNFKLDTSSSWNESSNKKCVTRVFLCSLKVQ